MSPGHCKPVGRYIEQGVHGGKGSAAHKAAVTGGQGDVEKRRCRNSSGMSARGDTVGDPSKAKSKPRSNRAAESCRFCGSAYHLSLLQDTAGPSLHVLIKSSCLVLCFD